MSQIDLLHVFLFHDINYAHYKRNRKNIPWDSITKIVIYNAPALTIPIDVAPLSALTSLTLSSTRFLDGQFPAPVFSLPTLTTLCIADSNFTSVPDRFQCLPNLQELMLTSDGLTTIPPSIMNCTQMKALDLHANDIKEIPREIAQLLCLKHLILSDNCIQCVPDEMEKCTALESLYLNKNNIRIIPESLKTLTHLHLFFVNGNPLNPEVNLNGYPALLPICKNIVR